LIGRKDKGKILEYEIFLCYQDDTYLHLIKKEWNIENEDNFPLGWISNA
jgi:hypothetical protein